jgi:hypothetical protein
MPLYQILVPSRNKDDAEILPSYHQVWDEKVREIAGGLTILSDAKGKWTSPDGKAVFEKMIPVLISCTPDQIEVIIDFTLEYYEQQAVFAFKMTDDVLIRYNKKRVLEFKNANKQTT